MVNVMNPDPDINQKIGEKVSHSVLIDCFDGHPDKYIEKNSGLSGDDMDCGCFYTCSNRCPGRKSPVPRMIGGL